MCCPLRQDGSGRRETVAVWPADSQLAARVDRRRKFFFLRNPLKSLDSEKEMKANFLSFPFISFHFLARTSRAGCASWTQGGWPRRKSGRRPSLAQGRGLRRGVDRPLALRRIEDLARRGDRARGDAGGDPDCAGRERAKRFDQAALGLGERLALRQAFPDRADNFAAGESAMVGEVVGGRASQINDLHSALLQDRTVGLLVRVERAEPGRVPGEKARQP